MNTIELAYQIVHEAFEGKTDLAGKPKLDHIKRVHEKLTSKNQEIQIIAVLHDLLEDCPEWNAKSLNTFFYNHIVNAVEVLTKGKSEPYKDYIQRVSENSYATIVKIADLEDNMSVHRLPKLTETDFKRLQKYVAAYQLLTK